MTMQEPATANVGEPIGVLVIGATGCVGRAVASSLLRAGYAVTETTRRADDAGSRLRFTLASDDPAMLDIDAGRYRFAVLAAGIAKVDECERNPAATRAVNVEATVALAERMWSAGVVPAWFSSDYVFDGQAPPHFPDGSVSYDESSRVGPLNEYGRQKVEVERFFSASGRPHLVVRLGRVVADQVGSGCVLNEACARLASGAVYRAAVDQIFSIIAANDIGRLLDRAFRAGTSGLLHAAAPHAISRYELISQFARELDLDVARVVPCRLAEVSDAARRPLNTSLRSSRAERELDFTFADPAEVVARAAAAYRASANVRVASVASACEAD